MSSRVSTAVLVFTGGLLIAPTGLLAQTAAPPNPTQSRTPDERRADEQRASGQRDDRRDIPSDVPIFRVTVVGRTTPAINYRHRGGATKIDFRGTPLLPESRGEAKVEQAGLHRNRSRVRRARTGHEIRPGIPHLCDVGGHARRPRHQSRRSAAERHREQVERHDGVAGVRLDRHREPYFAVSQPSDVVVMENGVRPDTRGSVETCRRRCDLLKRGTY